jgi:hypothetical protein
MLVPVDPQHPDGPKRIDRAQRHFIDGNAPIDQGYNQAGQLHFDLNQNLDPNGRALLSQANPPHVSYTDDKGRRRPVIALYDLQQLVPGTATFCTNHIGFQVNSGSVGGALPGVVSAVTPIEQFPCYHQLQVVSGGPIYHVVVNN